MKYDIGCILFSKHLIISKLTLIIIIIWVKYLYRIIIFYKQQLSIGYLLCIKFFFIRKLKLIKFRFLVRYLLNYNLYNNSNNTSINDYCPLLFLPNYSMSAF